ncbi:MAG: DoxX family protein [Bryobacteraceae bacterium]
MATQPQVHAEQVQHEPRAAHWSLSSLVGFRFCVIYFGLFCLTTQILGGLFPIPKVEIPDPATLWPTRQIVFWTAAHIFRVAPPLVYTGSGSGDKTFDWVLAFCLLAIAALATGVWSVLDRRRENYVALHKWFRLFIRFALASEMLLYGMDKVVPLQMPFPYLTRLLEPYGNFSPMGVLWSSIGASQPYEIFTGSAEMLGGILLVVPRTTMFGALICLADVMEIFMLNMTYDVPVKLFSFHLLLMASFLLAPEFRRLVTFLFLDRAAEPSTQLQLFSTRRANRIALAVQVIFGIWLVGMNAYSGWSGWYKYGGGRPKSPLYGIWDVDQIAIDGQLRSPLLTDYGRWRRVIFDFPTAVAFQRMDDSFASYGASIDAGAKTLALTKRGDRNWKASLSFQRGAQDQLILDGNMDSHKVHMQLHLVDRNKFLLVNRGFHWIQEYPFNR